MISYSQAECQCLGALRAIEILHYDMIITGNSGPLCDGGGKGDCYTL